MSEAGLLIFSSSFTLNNIAKQLSTGSLFMDQDLPIFNSFKPSNENEKINIIFMRESSHTCWCVGRYTM